MTVGRVRALISRNRLLWVGAAGGAAVLVVGLLVGRFLVPASSGPAELTAGLATVPVASGQLVNMLTLRGEAGYADPVEVTIDTAALDGPAIVTGMVPALNAELAPLSVALEVGGRPLIVLPGALPMYRTLQIGMSGPDVTQFKQAMQSVGISAGALDSDVFDESAAAAIATLYSTVGYSSPASVEGAADAVEEAKDSVQSAQLDLAGAKHILAVAGAGPTVVAVREADNSIASAQRALATAKNENPSAPAEVADLEDALSLAVLARAELNAPADTTLERLAVDAASASLTTANAALATAQQMALPVAPASELLYLDQLPRRVDVVNVTVGAQPDGAAMTVSGATLGLSGTIDPDDAGRVEPGGAASFDLPDGTAHAAVVSDVTPGVDAQDRPTVHFTPDPLSPEQAELLAGANVKVEIPISATAGEVLSVPAAALTAGPGGETRVEVVDGDPRDGAQAETRQVVVETGLAAEGAVEVHAVDGELAAGDLVVVGR